MNLPEEKQAQIADWLLSGLPYHQVKQLIDTELKITTSFGALSAFWADVCTPALLARRRRAVTTADEIADEASQKPGKFDEATIEALRQKAFELSVSPRADPRDVKSLFMLVLKARDQDLQERQVDVAERRVALLEQKISEARQALDQARGKTVDPQKLADELNRILGRKT